MLFDDVIEQEYVKKILRKSIENNSVSHSYIFVGSEGVGKHLIAKKFAQVLNCQKQKGCGECDSCKMIEFNNHPDVNYCFKENDNIKIEQIRDIIKKISFKPFISQKKFFVISDAETMTEEAQNCLLKTLEEPPGDAILILITTNISDLKETIISRCQILKFRRISNEAIFKILTKKYKIDTNKAHFISRLSNGNLKKAEHFIDSSIFEERENLIDESYQLIENEIDFEKIAKITKNGKQYIQSLLDQLLFWFYDLLLLKYDKKEFVLNSDKEEKLFLMLNKYSISKIIEIVNSILDTKKDVLYNINLKLSLEVLILKIKKEQYV